MTTCRLMAVALVSLLAIMPVGADSSNNGGEAELVLAPSSSKEEVEVILRQPRDRKTIVFDDSVEGEVSLELPEYGEVTIRRSDSEKALPFRFMVSCRSQGWEGSAWTPEGTVLEAGVKEHVLFYFCAPGLVSYRLTPRD